MHPIIQILRLYNEEQRHIYWFAHLWYKPASFPSTALNVNQQFVSSILYCGSVIPLGIILSWSGIVLYGKILVL